MKKAIIIIPTYAPPNALPSAAGNLAQWNAALAYRGFTSRQVLSGNVTRAQAMAALQTFTASIGPTDRWVVAVAGHGSQVPDLSGDEEVDHKDEVFVTSDLQYITDDEFNAILNSINPLAQGDMVYDCCYAGTMWRSPEIGRRPGFDPALHEQVFTGNLVHPKVKQLGNIVKPKTAQLSRIVPRPPEVLHQRFWQACQEGELAHWGYSGGVAYSAYTLLLCWTLQQPEYVSLSAAALSTMVSGWVTEDIPSQHPVMTGIDTNLPTF